MLRLMHPSLNSLSHRPWPLPERAWSWRQSWLDLAFIHYRVDVEQIRKLLPSGLTLQQFEGSAWVGLVPFRMAGMMRRPFPNIPPISSPFPELNLRTYVEYEGKPGVWFFSLDADSLALVAGGRYHGLPYFFATMRQELAGAWFSFSSARRGSVAKFKARYRPIGETFFPNPGTFEHWISERYCLYTYSRRKGIERLEVHHAPWPIQEAEVKIDESSIFEAAGIVPLDFPPVCHFSKGVDVVSFAKERL